MEREAESGVSLFTALSAVEQVLLEVGHNREKFYSKQFIQLPIQYDCVDEARETHDSRQR